MLVNLMIVGAEAAAEEAQGIAALGIDPKAILLQAGTFLILFFIIKKFAFNSIVSNLDKRREKIEESLNLAEKIEERNRKTAQETEAAIKKAKSEADEIIASANKEAGAIIKTAEDAAGKKAEKVLSDGHTKLMADIEKAKVELRSEMLGLVADATEQIIKTKLDSKADLDLIKKELGKK